MISELHEKMLDCSIKEKKEIINIIKKEYDERSVIKLCDNDNEYFKELSNTNNYSFYHIRMTPYRHKEKYVLMILDTEYKNSLLFFDWRNFVCYVKEELFEQGCWKSIEKDIEKLLTKNNREKCCEILKKMSMNLTQEIANILCKRFCISNNLFDENLFMKLPKYIDNVGELFEIINEEYSICDKNWRVNYITNLINKSKQHVNILDGGFWFYRDGVNYEANICNNGGIIEEIIWMIESDDMSDKDVEEYLELLKSLEKFIIGDEYVQ